MQQEWWGILVTGLVGTAGYLVKRWIERRRRSETMTRRLNALTLYRGLKSEGLTIKDLERIEQNATDDG